MTQQDARWRERAARVVPGGMYGHMATGKLPPGYPQFYARSEGVRVWDVDGRDYIDMMCAWGPMIVGYNNPVVEHAAASQAKQGDLLPGASPRMVELAELLVAQIGHADWAMFAKNGTDATTMAVTVARAATGRRKVLKARRAYHGADPWCTPVLAGVTPEDRANLVEFDYNDLDSVRACFDEFGPDIAAVIVCPVRQDVHSDQVPAEPGFARGVRDLCDRQGAALILDEVRCGFRLGLAGSWESLGVRPDLAAWSKALANGHALAAVTGTDALRQAASEIYVTGSFWFTSAAMAASSATMGLLRRDDAVAAMVRLGTRLCDGLRRQAAQHGLDVVVSGPPAMPFMRFADDPGLVLADQWCAVALRHGALVHPWHNWFISAAHTVADIDRVLEAADAAFRAVARSLPLSATGDY